VEALNQTGWVRTVFSCGGHPEAPDSVQRGRRQAHVDVLVADLNRWRALAQRCRRDAQAAVRQLDLDVRPRIRSAEGPLGPLPDWLRAAVEREVSASEGSGPGAAQARPAAGSAWCRLLTLLDVTRRSVGPPRGAQPLQWHYRRLVLEPAPYAMAPEVCRRVLDAALAAAVRAARAFRGEREA
jgi:hypothetical protein